MTDNFTPVQAQRFKLAGSGVTATATSIVLQSFKTPDGDTIALSDLGAQAFATMEPGTTREEVVTITGVTQNGDGTATLTATRGIDFVSPYAASAVRGKAHSGGTIFVLSNPAVFYDQWLGKNNDETIVETHTYTNPKFPRIDVDTSDPTDDEQFASKGYVDRTAGALPVSKNREVIAGTAGEVLSAGNIVYFDVTDMEWKLADASAAGTSENVLLGIAQGSGVNGGAISGGVLTSGLDANQSGMTAGTKQFLSDVAGALSESAGTREVSIGFSNSGSTTDLLFFPRYDQQLTEDQQDALAGSAGTPSAANAYVTEDDVSDAAASGLIVRATGTALPALDGSNLTNLSFNQKSHLFTSDVTFSNTTTETTILTYSLAANSLSTGNIVKIRIPITDFGLVSAGSDTFTLRLKYGATTVATFASTNDGGNFVATTGWIEALLLGAGTTSSQEGSITFFAAGDSFRLIAGTDAGTAAEDSTGALTLAVTGQFSVASASNDFTAPHGYTNLIR